MKFPLLLIFIYVCFFIIIILIKTQKQASFQVKKRCDEDFFDCQCALT